jgi:acylphosphatase
MIAHPTPTPPDDTPARLHAVIDGHVQGVGFRAFVLDRASSMGLTGWVRNTSSGEVEVLAEGPRNILEMLLEYLRSGPRSSFVTSISQEWDQPSGEFYAFQVRRTV